MRFTASMRAFAQTTPRAPCLKACSRRHEAPTPSAQLSFSKVLPRRWSFVFPMRAACRTDRVRGMAIKFRLPDGSEQDIVCISANGFPVATGEDFLALLQAVGASGPDVPKPTLVEKFLSTHPAASAFVTTPRPVAVSYGTQPFFGVNAFKFTNAQGTSKFGRYRIVPESGPAYVSDEEAAKRPPNALADNLRVSLEKELVKFRLLVQVAAADDSTTDATKVWPDSRPTVELGEIAVIKALDTKKVENELLFLPTNVTSGIDPSDDPIINTRTEAYAESFGRRTK